MDLTQVGAPLLVLVTSVVIAGVVVAAIVIAVQEQLLRWGGFIVVVAFLFIVNGGYLLGWKWTGVPNQTFWDWLKLLVVPAVLAIGGFFLNSFRDAAEERRAQDQRRGRWTQSIGP